MRKADIERHFRCFWWCYAAILIFAVVLWTSVYGIIEKPDANEKLTVSYFGDNYDGDKLELDIKSNISDITSQNIKEFNFDVIKETDGILLGSLIQTCLYSSDIMIFEEDIITDDIVSMNLRPFTSELEACFSELDVEYYEIDGIKYGIIIDSQRYNSNAFTKYYSGNGALVAFFAPYSENLGVAYGTGNKEDDSAIALMKFLLEETDE